MKKNVPGETLQVGSHLLNVLIFFRPTFKVMCFLRFDTFDI